MRGLCSFVHNRSNFVRGSDGFCNNIFVYRLYKTTLQTISVIPLNYMYFIK
jgi:hypothetical protein